MALLRQIYFCIFTIGKNRKTLFAPLVGTSCQQKFSPSSYEILHTPLILWEILIAPKASFYNLKYAKIVSEERGKILAPPG